MLYTRFVLQLSWYLLTPVFVLCIPQALYVKRTALRLPEAQGESHIRHGEHQDVLTFIHFGESTVAGVGVQKFEQGLSAQLCQTLSTAQQNTCVQCTIIGKNGISFRELNEQIQQLSTSADFAIITMGVNDTTGLTSVTQWQSDIQQCIKILNQKGIKQIFFTQVPPMAQFPALPAPLKYLLGLRAHILNTELQRLCEQHNHCEHVGNRLLIEQQMMAEDGYHPSEQGYKAWAKQITPQILKHLRR